MSKQWSFVIKCPNNDHSLVINSLCTKILHKSSQSFHTVVRWVVVYRLGLFSDCVGTPAEDVSSFFMFSINFAKKECKRAGTCVIWLFFVKKDFIRCLCSKFLNFTRWPKSNKYGLVLILFFLLFHSWIFFHICKPFDFSPPSPPSEGYTLLHTPLQQIILN